MKNHLLLLVWLTLLFITESCCLGTAKCYNSEYSVVLRIVAKSGGQDLIFGPNAVYDKNAIRFYSLSGSDSIFHQYQPQRFSGLTDSILLLDFDRRENSSVYIRLSNSDVDTIMVNYRTYDASPCCPDYVIAKPVSYNNLLVAQSDNGITTLRK